MLKYIIFILIFNVLHFVQAQFDIYEISDREPADNKIKRHMPSQGNLTNTNNDAYISPEIIPRRPADTNSVKKELNDKPKTISVSEHQEEKNVKNIPNPSVTSVTLNKTETVKNSTMPNIKNPKHVAIEHQGAVLRGFYVFLGLSVLIVIYFVFKAFRLRPGAPPPTTVRKYGIVGRRSDMEMLPLPLAEEEDDDTLFDMGAQVNR